MGSIDGRLRHEHHSQSHPIEVSPDEDSDWGFQGSAELRWVRMTARVTPAGSICTFISETIHMGSAPSSSRYSLYDLYDDVAS